MALRKVLAREFSWAVNTGTIAVPVWTSIGGITSFTPQPAKTDAVFNDFDNAGWQEHLVAGRSLAFTLDGFYIEDDADGSRDPGQQQVEVHGAAIGLTSLGQFQITTPGGTTITFSASVQVSPQVGSGGGVDDPGAWNCTLTMSGAPTIV